MLKIQEALGIEKKDSTSTSRSFRAPSSAVPGHDPELSNYVKAKIYKTAEVLYFSNS